MAEKIRFESGLQVTGDVISSGIVNALNTNVWVDTGTAGVMTVAIQGLKFGDNQDLITNYTQLVDVPIKIKKKLALSTTTLKLNVNALGNKNCLIYKTDNTTTATLPINSIQANQIITLVYNGTSFIVLDIISSGTEYIGVDTNSNDITVNGSSISVDTKLNPTADNGLTIDATGLYVKVANVLTSSSTTTALSANMGKQLNDTIGNIATILDQINVEVI